MPEVALDIRGVLAFFPVLFFFGYVAYFWERDGVMPPIGENLLYSAIVGMAIPVAGHPAEEPKGILVIAIAFVTTIVYLRIHHIQKKAVEDAIDEVLEKLPAGERRNYWKTIARAVVEPDFIVWSIPNYLSRFERQKRRQAMAKVLSGLCGKPVSDEEFFPIGFKKDWTVIATLGLAIISAGFFWYSMSLSNKYYGS